MEDDISKEGLPPLGIGDIETMKDLWRFRIAREDAVMWAFRDIRFLVYDDTDDKGKHKAQVEVTEEDIDNFASDDEQATLSRAIQLSLEVEEDASDNSATSAVAGSLDLTNDKSKRAELSEATDTYLETESASSGGFCKVPCKGHVFPPRNGDDDNTCKKCDGSQCGICSTLPEFPHDRKTRNFRLVSPTKSDSLEDLKKTRTCTHYVAVSYCWPEPKFDDQGQLIQTPGESRVRDLDGTIRNARALDDVLDRAVDFANCAGLRMIWIDQECLPQPTEGSSEEEKQYQRTGVQAMDIVYNRAIATVGLHDGTIANQLQANALRSLINLDKMFHEGTPTDGIRPEILDHLFNFLEIMIPDRWYSRAWVVQESISAGRGLFLSFRRGEGIEYLSSIRSSRNPTKHSLDSQMDQYSSQLINIHVDEFRGLIRHGLRLLLEYSQPGQVFYHSGSEMVKVLDHAASLHPVPTASKYPVILFSANNYGNRNSVNASTAVTLMKTRNCRDIQDKITIVANLCNYEVRLDPSQLSQNCNSLRFAILTLALLNGDRSILVPEVYSDDDKNNEYHVQNTRFGTGGLLSPFDTDPGRIDDYTLLEEGPLAPRSLTHANRKTVTQGLPLSAYIWTVEEQIDFSPVQKMFAKTWHEMKDIRIIVDRLGGESAAAYTTRRNAISQHFSNDDTIKRARRELLQHGSIDQNSLVWDGMDATGIRCVAELDAAGIRADPVERQKIAGIIFVILAYLNDAAPHINKAAGVANSIWQSIRVDCVTREGMLLPDVVNNNLFSHPDVLVDKSKTIQHHKGPGNTYLQLWFIDRIMQHGKLWIGTYNPAHVTSPNGTNDDGPPEQELLSIGGPGTKRQGDDSEASCSSSRKRPKRESSEFAKMGIVERQEVQRLMSSWLNVLHSQEPDRSSSLNNSTVVYLVDELLRDTWSSEAEEIRMRDLVSIFDVDGPCTVATPFNSEWESVPTPSLRSMSTCWVVEPVDRREYPSTLEIYTSSCKGKGSIPKDELHPKGEPGDGFEGTLPDRRLDANEDTPLYRVVNKVKGLWQILDMAAHEVLFM